MSYEAEPNTPNNEFEALAPVYLEILDKLSADEALKFTFYSLQLFEDPGANWRLKDLMHEHDEDAGRWDKELYEREEERRFQKEKEGLMRHFSMRAEVTSPIVQTADDGYTEFTRDGVMSLREAFEKEGDTSWWQPKIQHLEDEKGSIDGYIIVADHVGALQHMIGTDPETGKLAFGDCFHNISYDSKRQTLIGYSGARKSDLDGMGRYKNRKKAQRRRYRAIYKYLKKQTD